MRILHTADWHRRSLAHRDIRGRASGEPRHAS